MERKNKKMVTLQQLHEMLKNEWKVKKQRIQEVLDVKSDQTYYDIVSGKKKLNQIEKQAIAGIYNKAVDEIDWLDNEKPVA